MSESGQFYTKNQLQEKFKISLGASEFFNNPDVWRYAVFNRAYAKVSQMAEAELLRTTGKSQDELLTELCKRNWPDYFVTEEDPSVLLKRAIEYHWNTYHRTSAGNDPTRTLDAVSAKVTRDPALQRSYIFEYQNQRLKGTRFGQAKVEEPLAPFSVEIGDKKLSVLMDLSEMGRVYARRLYADRMLQRYYGPEEWIQHREFREAPSIGIAAESSEAFNQMLSEEMYRKPPALLDVAATANQLGLRKHEGSRKAARDSSKRHHYAELEALFRELREAADKMAADLTGADGVPPSELFVTLKNGLRFAMEKPEGKTKWLLAEESVPAVREHLGLTPNVAMSNVAATLVGGWGVTTQSREIE